MKGKVLELIYNSGDFSVVKNIKFLFKVIIVFLFLVYPSCVWATNKETDYLNIKDETNFEIEGLSFSDILFKDYSSNSTKSFGLTGKVTNNYNYNIYYASTVYYYDCDYNLITRSDNLGFVQEGMNAFNQMSNLNILGKNTIKEVCYYRLVVDTDNYVLQNKNVRKVSEYAYDDYVIDKYDVNVVVNENNTFDITETITAYFRQDKHGIFRVIPLINRISRPNDISSTNWAQIYNLDVNEEYTKTYEDKSLKIIIGSEERTIKGEKTYIISYTYNIGKDPMKNYDELYYNIIGNRWDTAIGNITFTITMPKEFDSSKLGFSSGMVGSTNNNVIYNVKGNKITGSYNGILDPGRALTVRCELPNGYFVKAGHKISSSIYVMIIIPILLLIVSIFLWYKYGRDDKLIETVEFYPPDGFNSLEVGYLYKGSASTRDVVSLLIYLANKGYIKISDYNEYSEKFTITKLKEYDGNNTTEKLFLDGLFLDSKKNDSNLDFVTLNDLYDSFYITVQKILAGINNKMNKYKIFDKDSLMNSIILILLMVISISVTLLMPVVDFPKEAGIEETIIIAVTSAVFVFASTRKSVISGILFGIFELIIFGNMALPTPVGMAITNDRTYLIAFIIGALCFIGMIILFKLMPKRTPFGNEKLAKIKGFRKFLITAKKDELEAMVMKYPTYFYDIIPFTYALEVSDKWIKKFEAISLEKPSWCDDFDAFDSMSFASFVDSAMSSATSVMTSGLSSDGSSSSGDSSGGGSSGGGSGGGGGGSW